MKQINSELWDHIWKHAYVVSRVQVDNHARDHAWLEVENPIYRQQNRQLSHLVDRELRSSSMKGDSLP